jgi:hypothetical protein|tara:strand:+ start:206 stop:472 length:267 start_codon:yes stop_codon:yes gene_type:complete
MALKKQSIRKHMTIYVNGTIIPKEELILISESWNEKQESFFRKMLKQGGSFKINGIKYEISLKRDDRYRSDGTKDSGVKKIPGEDGKF